MVKEKAKGEKDIAVGNVATLDFYRKMITGWHLILFRLKLVSRLKAGVLEFLRWLFIARIFWYLTETKPNVKQANFPACF